MSIFSDKSTSNDADFGYLNNDALYFDSACQTLRPQSVIDAQNEYYTANNACGHRVKYKWGEIVDNKVDATRMEILKLTGKSAKDYTVAFTLNTTTGINQILHQIKPEFYNRIITSNIEHNSVFLPSITWAKKHNKERLVLDRTDDGSLNIDGVRFDKDIVLVNTTCNFDGRNLVNAPELAKICQSSGSRLLIDGAQTLGHEVEFIKNTEFDALFSSGHKMYGPSIGIIVIKKTFLEELDLYMLGGGTVEDVNKDDFQIIRDQNELYTRLEIGLQNFGGIIGLGEAIRWRKNFNKDGQNANQYEHTLAKHLFKELKTINNIEILNQQPSGTVSFYSQKIEAHKLGVYLGEQNIMFRTGYFCCFYYLKNLKKYPPLVRISLGLNNTTDQIDKMVDSFKVLIGR